MDLPTILAGPILRRVEPTQIVIWAALSENYQVTAKLYHIDSKNDKYQYEMISDLTETQAVQLGKNIYINLIKIVPTRGTFPTKSLLGYNLMFTHERISMDLNDFQLLTPNDPHSIVYGDLKYPSFYINDDANETRFLYGSCRKQHGKNPDALVSGDRVLNETFSNVASRPSSLFMMGDQIYADDVADPLAPFLYKLGNYLMGENENLSQIEPKLKNENTINQIGGRSKIMKEYCGFTSSHSDNHMMSLGEYTALYLCSWSPEILQLAFEENQIESFNLVLSKEGFHEELLGKQQEVEIDTLRKRYNEQKDELISYLNGLPQIRRLLANIPTYMIFDDHDLTDDWNITEKWKETVSNKPLGRHIIANGLTAYWAFQGWGNEPIAFSKPFMRTMKSYLNSKNLESEDYREWLDTILGFDSWHYIAPTFPKAVVLDTRTQRLSPPAPDQFNLEKYLKYAAQGPNLIRNEAWNKVDESLKQSKWKSNSPLIIISPCPLYGISLIETFLLQFMLPLSSIYSSLKTMLDLEWWKFNGRGYTTFHQQIAKWDPSDCIILSGDVHMAFSLQANVQLTDQPDERIIYQFTSSPMKNMSFDGLKGVILKALLTLHGKYTVNRYCDSSNLIGLTDSRNTLWKEKISYHLLKDDSIANLDNNLGSFFYSANVIQNRLLNAKGEVKNMKTYKK
ncbi:hypothetical protein [Bacillus sp. PS06]|uniref:hypothetical protein n=1 Tax=Bacillus sp. PS06 TaxID=2764176 RepID=UPI001784DF5E|nr:hypothetical protein [Bacillus sp. PS06]MBD8067952.1 hypothetical protein [Bacillus sp. PS06]